ncbi:MAG: glycosyl transferase [Clostridiales bacterium]|nr:glycosyl transferase [Clostridiales bacterium]
MRKKLYNAFFALSRRGAFRWMGDRAFLRLQYFLKRGKILHLNPPKTYGEKLQWLKLHDRNPEYCTMVDKIAARDFVAARVGEKYLIPEIARYDRVEDINWEKLPNRFVMKCAHGSSANILCRDKDLLDIEDAKQKLNGWMQRNWFWVSREWPYKDIPARILVETFLPSEEDVPRDYKILCFDGEPKYIIVDFDRFTNHTRNYYDTDWNRLDMTNRHPNYLGPVERPHELDEMLDVARKLSQGVRHLRVDLYAVSGKVYFGELTFYHGYGMEEYSPESFEYEMGSLIRL